MCPMCFFPLFGIFFELPEAALDVVRTLSCVSARCVEPFDSTSNGATQCADTPCADTPRADTPRADTPQADTPRANKPRADNWKPRAVNRATHCLALARLELKTARTLAPALKPKLNRTETIEFNN